MLIKILVSCLMGFTASLTLAHPGIHEQIEALNERLKQKPTYQLFAQRAHLYFEGGQLDSAYKDLDAASKLGPKEPLLFEYGNVALAKGDPSKALKYFNQFIKFNQQYPEVFQARAKAFQKLGQTEEAIQDIKKSLQLQPSPHPGLYIEAANLIYAQKAGQFELALKLLDEGIQRLGVQGQLQERAIEILLESKQPEKASERMLYLGKERNYNVFWRFDYAQLLVKSGRISEAQTELKRALLETKGVSSAAVSDIKIKINQQLMALK